MDSFSALPAFYWKRAFTIVYRRLARQVLGQKLLFGNSRQPQFRTVIHTRDTGLSYAINALLLAKGIWAFVRNITSAYQLALELPFKRCSKRLSHIIWLENSYQEMLTLIFSFPMIILSLVANFRRYRYLPSEKKKLIQVWSSSLYSGRFTGVLVNGSISSLR